MASFISNDTTTLTNLRLFNNLSVDGTLTVQNFSANSFLGMLSANTINAESGLTVRVQNGYALIAKSVDSGGVGYNVRAFGAVGDGIVDDTASIRTAMAAAIAADAPLIFPPGKFKVTAPIDSTSNYGVRIVGSGHNAGPTFDGTATQIIQYSNNTAILRVYGPCSVENLYLAYNSQQTSGATLSTGLELNNISGSVFKNIKVYRGYTNVGLPQQAFGATTYNILFDSAFHNIQSYEASECHYDLRNFAGGGTNVRLDAIYANGGGSADFATSGTSANYAIRGNNWFGYEWGAVSVDGLEFWQRILDTTNCWFTVGTFRCEGDITKKNSDGWINVGGANTLANIQYSEFRNCRALATDVSTSFLYRANATEYVLRVGEVNVVSDCSITATTFRPLQIAGSPSQSSSAVYFGRISDATGTFAPTTWTDSASGVRIIRSWNDQAISQRRKQYQSTAYHIWQVDSAAPGSGTWIAGDRTEIMAPGDLGRPVLELCTTGGTPGTWVPYALAGMFPFSTQTDIDVTLTPRSSRFIHRFATTLTADRTITLSSTNAWNGCAFNIVRPAAGNFILNVGGLASLSSGQACQVAYDGSAFRLTGLWNLQNTPTVTSTRTIAASSLTASAANSTMTTNEVLFSIGGASGASLAIHSGGTVYIFNSALSAKAT